jgi:hypothetical protein
MFLKILALAILTESIVELIFTAAPLQEARAWLIKKSPLLRAGDQGHLLECKYCTSFWVAGGVILLAWFADCQALRLASAALVVARTSNYAHLIYGFIRDSQINKRLERK